MKYQNVILSLLISLTALIGDHIVFDTPYSSSHVYRGIADNLVHALIGSLSSYLFLACDSAHSREAIAVNVAVCTAISSLIDFDHAIVAGSIYWKDLKNFKHRGIFHCSSVWFAASGLLIIWSLLTRRINYNILGWMLLIAFTSHHARDANRRGFWLWPFGHTRSLGRNLYILLLVALPNAYCYVYKATKPSMLTYKTVDHVV